MPRSRSAAASAAAPTTARCCSRRGRAAAGVELRDWRGLADIPAFDEDLDAVPPPVAALRREIAEPTPS